MSKTIAEQLSDLDFKYESSNDESVIYSAHGQQFNERIYVIVNVATGEVEANRVHDEITEKPPLVVRWSAWDDTTNLVLERWVS